MARTEADHQHEPDELPEALPVYMIEYVSRQIVGDATSPNAAIRHIAKIADFRGEHSGNGRFEVDLGGEHFLVVGVEYRGE